MTYKTATHFFLLVFTCCYLSNINAQQLKLEITNVKGNSCFGQCNASADAAVTGGIAPYTFLWSNGQSNKSSVQLCAGTYTCVVKDSKGATVSAAVIITNPEKLVIDLVSTPVVCNKNNGSATVIAKGGKPPYSYNWSTNPAQTTATATNLAVGSYACTVADSNGCREEAIATIKAVSALTLNVTSKDVSCYGSINGSATASVSPDPGNIKYSWSTVPPQNTPVVNKLQVGTYSVTITDGLGCTASKSIEIKQPPLLTLGFDIQNANCGLQNGKLTAVGAGGSSPYTYGWNTTPSQTTAEIDKLKAGNYNCTVTDKNACTAAATATVKNTATLTLSIASKDITCFGKGDGSAVATVGGGSGIYIYKWNTSPVQTTAAAGNLKPGTYELQVKDSSGCTAAATVSIKQPSELVTTVKTTEAVCGKETGTAVITASGGTPGYSYAWNTTPVQTTAQAEKLKAGTYNCIVTDKNGCSNEVKCTVTTTGTFKLDFTTTIAKCYGDSSATASVTVKQSGGAYTYIWNTKPVQTAATATNLKAGKYSVTVINDKGCEVKDSIEVKQPAKLILELSSTDATCGGNGKDGSAYVNPVGGTPAYTYRWTTSPVQTSPTVAFLPSGTYTVFVKDNNSCSATGVVVVHKFGNFTFKTKVSDISCFGKKDGAASVVEIGGGKSPYKLLWNTNPAQTAATATNLAAGSYTCTITDASGCETIATVLIREPGRFAVSITPGSATVCNGQALALKSTVAGGKAGYTYLWSTTPPETSKDITVKPMVNTTYYVIATDSNGCKAKDSSLVVISTAIADVSGKAYYNSAIPVDSSKVYLYDASKSGKLNPKDSAYTDLSGAYLFSSITAGTYKLLIVPKNRYSFLAQNYYAKGYTWDSARVITLNCGDHFKAAIAIDSVTSITGGTGKISGKLIADNNYGHLPAGSPVKGVNVNLVLHPGNKLIASAITDITGSYVFSSLAPTPVNSSYYVYINMPGYSQAQTYILPLAATEIVQARNYTIGSKTIYLSSSSAVNNIAFGSAALLTAYPNPYNDLTTIKYELEHTGNVSLSIYNLVGQKVQELESGVKTAGKYEVPFVAAKLGLSSGIYIAQLQVSGKLYTIRLVELH